MLIFLSAYLISLFLWIQIKDTYGYAITATASRLVAEVKNVRVEKTRQEKDTDNMLIRCEPFLIGFYMYIRFRR